MTCFRAIQSENKPCPRSSFAFHAKRVKEALRTMLRGKKITQTKIFALYKKNHLVKIHLKSTGFSLLLKLTNVTTLIPIISLYEGSEQFTQTGKLLMKRTFGNIGCYTTQKMKFSIKDFLSKFLQFRSFL